jgi:hypothetical protein
MAARERPGHFVLVLRRPIARARRGHIHHCDGNESRVYGCRFVEGMSRLVSRVRLRHTTDDVMSASSGQSRFVRWISELVTCIETFDSYPEHSSMSAASNLIFGSRRTKTVFPAIDSSRFKLPPCSRTAWSAIVRPRPRPVIPSAVTNG